MDAARSLLLMAAMFRWSGPVPSTCVAEPLRTPLPRHVLLACAKPRPLRLRGGSDDEEEQAYCPDLAKEGGTAGLNGNYGLDSYVKGELGKMGLWPSRTHGDFFDLDARYDLAVSLEREWASRQQEVGNDTVFTDVAPAGADRIFLLATDNELPASAPGSCSIANVSDQAEACVRVTEGVPDGKGVGEHERGRHNGTGEGDGGHRAPGEAPELDREAEEWAQAERDWEEEENCWGNGRFGSLEGRFPRDYRDPEMRRPNETDYDFWRRYREGHLVNKTRKGLHELQLAAGYNDCQEIERLVSEWCVDPAGLCDEISREQAIHFAAFNGHIDACMLLLDLGADPDASNYFEQTPLHRAAYGGCSLCVCVCVCVRSRSRARVYARERVIEEPMAVAHAVPKEPV